MIIVGFFKHILTAILAGYLAFTTFLADSIDPHTAVNEPEKVAEAVAPDQKLADAQTTERAEVSDTPADVAVAPAEASTELTPLTSEYVEDASIPNVLVGNKEYQDAAVASAWQNYAQYPAPQQSYSMEDVMVDIYCQYKTGRYLRVTTGSGFFIHPSGVILTSAHVAQFLLLQDVTEKIRDAQCYIMNGNPAKAVYKAKLLYISPSWIFANAHLISEEDPTGTGERDYALLYVSEALDGEALPEQFPTLPLNTGLISRFTTGSEVTVSGYLASSLEQDYNDSVISLVVATSSVGELYTYGTGYADVFDLSNSIAGEHGVSGGPVLDANGNVFGMIVTKGDPDISGKQSLRALTLSYIDRTIAQETGYSLMNNLNGDIGLRGQIFRKVLVPFLTELLVYSL